MKRRMISTLSLLCVGALLLAVQALRAGTWFSSDRVAVWVFDVGQGDAIFIDGPERDILIDGGPSDAVLEKLGRVLPPWDRTIDVVIATHPHADHINGLLAVLEEYEVGEVVDSGLVYDEAPAVAFDETVGAHAVAATQGMAWDVGNGATLSVVWPPTSMDDMTRRNVHDANVVTLLTYGDTTMLFTGDAETEIEEQFAPQLSQIDVLKVGHHGSDTSTGSFLLNLIRPAWAVISVGDGNAYGHPSAIVADRLRGAGVRILRTDVDGDIRFLTNGHEPVMAKISLE